jgi:hypothetical protein
MPEDKTMDGSSAPITDPTPILDADAAPEKQPEISDGRIPTVGDDAGEAEFMAAFRAAGGLDEGDAGDEDDAAPVDTDEDDEGTQAPADADEDDAGDDDQDGDGGTDAQTDDADVVAGLIEAGLSAQEALDLIEKNRGLAEKLAAKFIKKPEEPAGDAQAAEDGKAEAEAPEDGEKALRDALDGLGMFEAKEIEGLTGAIMKAAAGAASPERVTKMVEQAVEPVRKFAEQYGTALGAIEYLTWELGVAKTLAANKFPELADAGVQAKVREQAVKLAGLGKQFASPQDMVEQAAAIAIGSGRAKKIADFEGKKKRAKHAGQPAVTPGTRETPDDPEYAEFMKEYSRQAKRA